MKKFYFLLLALGIFTSVNAQVINFPDQNLLNTLVQGQFAGTYFYDQGGNTILDFDPNNPNAPIISKIDFNDNGVIELDEASRVYKLRLNVSNGVVNLSGLNQFSNLSELWIEGDTSSLQSLNLGGIAPTINGLFTWYDFHFSNVDLNHFPNLERLGLSNGFSSITFHPNNLTSIKSFYAWGNAMLNYSFLNNLTNLEVLSLQNCQISSTTNFNTLARLKELRLQDNLFSSIDLIPFPNLELLHITNNMLPNINVSFLTNLKNLAVTGNQLTDLNLEGLSHLEELRCGSNLLTTLDLNNFPLTTLQCENNLLTHLSIKNGTNIGYIYFAANPSLEYICADEGELTDIQNKINQYGYTNCNLNSYCSFTPGGTFYTIQGSNKFDSNNNGCDASDLSLSNLKYAITDGTATGNIISNASGNYSIPVQAGTHTLTPVLENPTYFTILPTSTTVSFPTQTSPFTQDFCITPNGSHSDIEVSMIPVQAARPGFDAKYKIIYKNKGNQIESGNISLNFDDAKMDLVSAGAAPTQSTGLLTWNYSDLKPFETRTIDVVFNINSPMESPAVNGGDVLSYTTTITSGNSDEMPNDNTFTLNQTVVNSFDPNDITCLEGEKVSTSKIGDYVHYMIRFENTGSANATNIVVKDVVDAAKYDVNSIVPINGSHDFYTRINGNNVEFIFENINLPFDDASNDGHVAFKIKTKSTLVTGDTFSKNANIYFDYNFPIVTNTATTTIAALSNQDFEFKSYFKIYPNPVHNSLTIETKDAIQVSSINIYNTLGQLVLVIPNANNVKAVDVSSLTSGNYFIKINSDKGTSNTKFIKN